MVGSSCNLHNASHYRVSHALWACLVALLVNCLLSHHGGVGSGCHYSDDVGVVCTNEDLPDEGEWMWVSRRNFSVK